MLYLMFRTGNQRFIVDGLSVFPVIPMILPVEKYDTGQSIYGLLNFNGEMIPLLDFCSIHSDRPAAKLLNTRIIVLEQEIPGMDPRKLGVIAEGVSEIVTFENDRFQMNPFHNSQEAYIQKIVEDDQGVVKQIDVDQLFTICDLESMKRVKQ